MTHLVLRATGRAINYAMAAWNAIVQSVRRDAEATEDPDLRAIRARALVGTDISSHLETMFLEGVRAKPRLIVELGVRGGESTFVFAKVARRFGAALVSVDIDPCDTVCDYERWHFVQEDDVALGRRFEDWCRDRKLPVKVDLLFIDTSHLYEHTVAELNAWFPHLAEHAAVLFHDTNMGAFFRRRDYTVGRAWDNDRGVIRALEERLGTAFDETRPFQREAGSWQVIHDPVCCGLTVLRR